MIRREFIKGALVAGVAGGVGAAPSTASAERGGASLPSKPSIMFYHDGRHPLIYMYEPPMQKAEYEAGVDELVGTPVQALMFAMGDGRTVLHDTKVGELWGHHVDRWPHIIFRRAHQNAKALIDSGNDPLRVICDRAHAKGMLFYPVLLVQQGTRDRAVDVRASEFNLTNRHLWIGAGGGLGPDHPGASCLDFKHQEVRDERFALIQETLSRYPVDGFELQLNYGSHYFHPKEVEPGRKVMTDWIARVHRAVHDSGAHRELVIRIPSSLEGCYDIGLDVKEWIRRGIVDVLVPENLGGPELVDHTADFSGVVKAVHGTSCRVNASIHSHVDSDRLGEANMAMVRGAACNYWDQGVDGLYLAYWFNNWPYQASFYEKLREMPDPEVMAPRDKFYYIPTTTGRYQEPKVEPGLSLQLPADVNVNQPVKLEVPVSDDLRRWDADGRVHDVILRLRIMNVTELDRWTIRFNGKPLPDSLLRMINEMYRMSAPRYRTGSGYWFVYRLNRAHWPIKGKNTVEVTLTHRDRAVLAQPFIRDVELETKYLMGKKFHRGQDPDLGDYEHGGV